MIEATAAPPTEEVRPPASRHRIFSDAFLRRPISSCRDNSGNALTEGATDTGGGDHDVSRHLTLFDLSIIGIGGTIGSGIFVLCGSVARHHAGPAVTISWILAGGVALLSSCCYAELSANMPVSGSSYIYTYVAMGEMPATIAAAVMTLEYLVTAAAVSRSWGDKVFEYATVQMHVDGDGGWARLLDPTNYPLNFSPAAFCISFICVIVLLYGVKESKAITTFVTTAKIAIVLFVIISGSFYITPANYVPYIPPAYGFAGVLRGTTRCIFGFNGFDEVCCVAGESLRPTRDVPRAIFVTVLSIMVLYVGSSAVLTGMIPYLQISDTSGFPDALADVGAGWAGKIAAAGEVATLPIVILIGLMAQPRLMAALAHDGLAPAFFGRTDEGGNLFYGIAVVGAVMIFVASVVPFEHLNDTISAGVLVCYSMTAWSLVLLRLRSPTGFEAPLILKDVKLGVAMGCFNIFAFATAVGAVHLWPHTRAGQAFTVVCAVASVAVCTIIRFSCPEREAFGENGNCSTASTRNDLELHFQTPLVPWLPCGAIFLNYYLISQLEMMGIVLLLAYLGVAMVYYAGYGSRHSLLRKQEEEKYGLVSVGYNRLEEHNDEEDIDGILVRTLD